MTPITPVFADFQPGWKTRIKQKAWEKIYASPLMRGCIEGDIRFAVALLAGYWNFVDRFPSIIEGTFSSASDDVPDKLRTFLRRAAKTLAGTLASMEGDERQHRELWIRASKVVGLGRIRLDRWEVLPEVDTIARTIGGANISTKLLYFAGVEIVAEGISKCLSESHSFTSMMGREGMRWFQVHLLHPESVTTHEDIAYRTAEMLLRAEDVKPTEAVIDGYVQECVDLFIQAAEACALKFGRTPIPLSELA